MGNVHLGCERLGVNGWCKRLQQQGTKNCAADQINSEERKFNSEDTAGPAAFFRLAGLSAPGMAARSANREEDVFPL